MDNDLFNNMRLVILNNKEENIKNKYNKIKIENIKIDINRKNIHFYYIINKKIKEDNYEEYIKDNIIIDNYDGYWLNKDYKYIKIKRDNIYSIYINIIYKNNINNDGEYYIQYSINDDKNYSKNLKGLDIIYNTTNINGYIKIIINSSKLIYNSIIYDKNGHNKDYYLYNIKRIDNNHIYNIKPLSNVPIEGDYSIKILNEDDKEIDYKYIYIQENILNNNII
jgi:hypothetical protein